MSTDKKAVGLNPLVRPPHEVGKLTVQTVNRWRAWFKEQDGGDGSYGQARLQVIDNICDAAIIGMENIKSSKRQYRATCVKMLRELADSIERGE